MEAKDSHEELIETIVVLKTRTAIGKIFQVFCVNALANRESIDDLKQKLLDLTSDPTSLIELVDSDADFGILWESHHEEIAETLAEETQSFLSYLADITDKAATKRYIGFLPPPLGDP